MEGLPRRRPTPAGGEQRGVIRSSARPHSRSHTPDPVVRWTGAHGFVPLGILDGAPSHGRSHCPGVSRETSPDRVLHTGRPPTRAAPVERSFSRPRTTGRSRSALPCRAPRPHPPPVRRAPCPVLACRCWTDVNVGESRQVRGLAPGGSGSRLDRLRFAWTVRHDTEI